MATKFVGTSGAALDREWTVHPGESELDGAQGTILGVRYGGWPAKAKRVEVTFYAIVKQAGALWALWYIATQPTGWTEWSAFALFYVLGILAMSLGYHRFFAHRAFETSRAMEYVIGIWAQMGAYGSLRNWCADHRRHHARSDRPGDAHSPYFDAYGRPLEGGKGLRHAHIGWLYDDATTDFSVYGKGLAEDPVLTFCHRTRMFWFVISMALLPAVWAFVFSGPEAILGTILIAGCLRMALNLHAIALVNSIGHRYGTQRFEGEGGARNNALIALITLGEGWHNNHHGNPRAANAGMARWEVDMTAWLIRGMEKLGLIWNVRRAKLPEHQQSH